MYSHRCRCRLSHTAWPMVLMYYTFAHSLSLSLPPSVCMWSLSLNFLFFFLPTAAGRRVSFSVGAIGTRAGHRKCNLTTRAAKQRETPSPCSPARERKWAQNYYTCLRNLCTHTHKNAFMNARTRFACRQQFSSAAQAHNRPDARVMRAARGHDDGRAHARARESAAEITFMHTYCVWGVCT